ncbi:MAG: hypothetical protein ACK50T_08880, partial [Sphingobacteriia bacterium]
MRILVDVAEYAFFSINANQSKPTDVYMVKHFARHGCSALFARVLFLVLLVFLFHSAQAQVGIGTTTPNAKALLELNIGTTARGLLLPRMNEAARDGMSLTATERGMLIYNTTQDRVQVWNGTLWQDAGGSSGPWMQTGDNVYPTDNAAYVGIGTTDPRWNLEVFNPTSTDSDVSLTLYNSRTNRDAIIRLYTLTDDNDAAIFVDESDQQKLKFSAGVVTDPTALSSSTRMTLTQAGNLGIGTTAPLARLHVEGPSGSTLRIVDGNQSAGRVLTSDASGNATWQSAPVIGSGTAGRVTYWQGTTQIASSGMTWDNTNGRLGIGTTAPTQLLHLLNPSTQAQDALLLIENDRPSHDVGLVLFSEVGGNDASVFLDAADNDALKFSMGDNMTQQSTRRGQARMTLTQAGNVGIGTTTAPLVRLHVEGPSGSTLRIVDGNQSDGRVLTSDNNGVAKWAPLPSLTGGTANRMTYWSSASQLSSTSISWDATNSRLGIGTTTPTASLHIAGAGTFRLENGAAANLVLTSDASGNASWQTLPPATLSGGTNGRVTYWTGTGTVAAGTNLAWDNANNRLGIGTTTPSVALDVKTTTGFVANLEMYSNTTSAVLSIGSSVGSSPGNFNALPSGSVLGTINLRGTNGTAFRIGAAITSQAEEGWTASRNGASLRFQTTENTTNALQTRMTINHDGNVGIGTTDPTWKLDIRNPTATNDDVCMGLWNDRANRDAIIRLHTLAGAEDVGIFLDETDGRKLKFALGDVATDANLQNNTRITITQTGRVGIGTTDPRVPLDVQGFNDLTGN